MRVVNEEYGEKFRSEMSVEDKSGKNLFKLGKKVAGKYYYPYSFCFSLVAVLSTFSLSSTSRSD